MPLVLAVHAVPTPSANVPFAVILLQDAISNQRVPAGLKCRQASGLVCTRSSRRPRACRAVPALSGRHCADRGRLTEPRTGVRPAGLLPPAAAFTAPNSPSLPQLVPSSGSMSSSLWDVSDPEELKQWLDEVGAPDEQAEL